MHKFTLGALALTMSLVFAALGSVYEIPGTLPSADQAVAAVILHDQTLGEIERSTFLDLDKVLGEMVVASSSEATSTPAELEEAEAIDEETPAIVADPSEATVKIRCVQTTDTYKRIATGTGFLINATGVIMTNAHVAQFLLLKDAAAQGSTQCHAMVGTDDDTAYALGLLYISPSWLLKHASLISTTTPKGTGENDFALTYITGRADGAAINTNFPFLPPATDSLSKTNKDKEVTIIGYPRQEDKSAPQMIATTTITGLYTFGSGYADILSLASSTLGHNGASGGPVVDEFGRAIGIITTKDSGTTVLNAITLAHMDRALKSEIGFDLASYLQGDLGYKAKLFNQTVSPILQEILAGYLTD